MRNRWLWLIPVTLWILIVSGHAQINNGGAGGSSFPISTAQTVNSGGSLTPTGTGQIASIANWLPFGPGASVPGTPTLTAALTGGALGTANTVYVRLTFVGPATIIPSPEVMLQLNATTGCGSGSICSVTVTMPSNCTSPVAPATGCTVWSSNTLDLEKQQAASAACVNITSATCVIGTLGAGSFLSATISATSGVNPSPLGSATLPDFITPDWFMLKADGNYYPLAGIDTSALNLISCCWTANAVTPPTRAGTNGGTFTWTDRFFINDDVNPPPISNSLVSIKHESGATTSTLTSAGGGVDDRALVIRIDNDLTSNPNYQQYLAQYNEAYADNANMTCAPVGSGTVPGETCVGGGRFTAVDQRNGTGNFNLTFEGVTGIATSTGTTVKAVATPAFSGVKGGAAMLTNNQNGNGAWWAGGFFGANSVSGATNASGVGIYIQAPASAWPTFQSGAYIQDYGSSATSWDLVAVSTAPATNGKSLFQGPIYFPKVVASNGTIPVAGSFALTGGLTTSQLAAPTLSGISIGGTPGSSTNVYKATCVDATGAETTASASSQTTLANANLTASNFDIVQFVPTAGLGCSSYNVYRTSAASTCNGSGCTNGKIGSTTPAGVGITGGQQVTAFNDTGQVGDGNTAVSQANTTGALALSGALSKNNNINTTGVGAVSVQASPAVIVIGSGTSIGNTSLCSTTLCPAGTYVVNTYIDLTTACGTSGTYVVNLLYTDDQGAKSIPANINGTGAVASTGVLTTTSTANFGEDTQVIRTTGAANNALGSINYSTTAVACGTAGPMVGNLYLSVTRVQ